VDAIKQSRSERSEINACCQQVYKRFEQVDRRIDDPYRTILLLVGGGVVVTLVVGFLGSVKWRRERPFDRSDALELAARRPGSLIELPRL
jgi:hypothetical protein